MSNVCSFLFFIYIFLEVIRLASAAQADRKNIESAFAKLNVLAREQAAAIIEEVTKLSELEKKRVELDSRLQDTSLDLQRISQSDADELEKLYK